MNTVGLEGFDFGRPNRVHPTMTNVNIGPFPNVDVVADAHHLPYADECVDAVHSEAVFEHLANPARAAKEVFRVLKTNGRAFVCTPFLQPYHGYPDHYQNFTLTGHRGLFESKGFEILGAGTCVGPVYTMANIMLIFLSEFSPAPLRRPLSMVWQMMSMAVRPLDKILNERKNSHVLVSTTYLLARKPPQPCSVSLSDGVKRQNDNRYPSAFETNLASDTTQRKPKSE